MQKGNKRGYDLGKHLFRIAFTFFIALLAGLCFSCSDDIADGGISRPRENIVIDLGNGTVEVRDIGDVDQFRLIIRDKAPHKVIVDGGVETIPVYAFNSFTSIEEVVLKDGIVEIGDSAFRGCSSLKSIAFPESLKSIGPWAFMECTSLTGEIAFPSSLEIIWRGAFRDDSGITSIVFKGGNFRVENKNGNDDSTIGTAPGGAFYGCSALQTIKVEGRGNAFFGDFAFASCSSLTSVTSEDASLSLGKRAFEKCGYLVTYKNGTSGNSSESGIDEYAFFQCTSLDDVSLPNNLHSIGVHAFSGCSALSNIVIPNSVVSIGGQAFYQCIALESATLPNNPGFTLISKSTFSDCSALSTIAIPDSVETIGDSAFMSCSSLVSVTIGKDSSKLTTLGDSAFNFCDELVSFVLPNRLKTIGKYALHKKPSGSHSSLKGTSDSHFVIPSSVVSIGEGALGENSELKYVDAPSSLESSYESTSRWGLPYDVQMNWV